MTLRGIIWLAVLFAIAAALATVGRFDTGQVLIVYPPYRIDVSLNFFVLAIIVAFIVLYALMRIVRNVWRMPQRVAAYRARMRNERAQAALRDALAVDANQSAASLVAAAATHRMHEYARRDEWLAKVSGQEWQDARLLATADMRADGRDAEGALAALAEMQASGGKRIHAQQIALRAQQQNKNWAEVLKIAKALEKREALHPAAAVRLRQQAAEHLLRDRRHDADALLEVWQSLSATERQSPRLADLAAELLIALERRQEARRIVEDALAHNWNARLLRRYPDTAGADALPLIQKAEGWRRERPDDADLLFALGRLCQQQQLWGKAQSFLESALKLADDEPLRIRAHRALARLFEHLGETDKAAQHYRESALAITVV
ncbi:heme biosynthesis protein HemY [Burkholderia mallei]|uniref:heme biosynthesis protein HemY n=1 Tax=Burkholderia mallei TaxID=13373 RepID=UPI0006B29FDC|nr:heme biosynthesis protein HemY [Burkholderia mallei]ATD99361.1 heme biosynthesis protein HemY [Burkholderia mallei]ATE04266.1 heme biosynthesis protein HemY [Burkholderia mallei]ATE09095.1 heme biosynthesis protein HemY [Burkholderia mallei]KOS76214.1 tetratricopeptide repeat family protein [Burkholderia mallei]KOT02076.1 tetratricopeptide repeat family protein [Burkholderia mallei]